MSLKSYFQEQFEQLSDFMISLREVVRCVRIDPEMKPMLSKVLARMDDDDQDFPHVFVSYAQSFRDAKTYFEGLAALISGEYVKNAQALREAVFSSRRRSKRRVRHRRRLGSCAMPKRWRTSCLTTSVL
jgi:hypothetical protein